MSSNAFDQKYYWSCCQYVFRAILQKTFDHHSYKTPGMKKESMVGGCRKRKDMRNWQNEQKTFNFIGTAFSLLHVGIWLRYYYLLLGRVFVKDRHRLLSGMVVLSKIFAVSFYGMWCLNGCTGLNWTFWLNWFRRPIGNVQFNSTVEFSLLPAK